MLAWYFKSMHSYYSAFNKLYFKLYNFYFVNLDKKKIRVMKKKSVFNICRTHNFLQYTEFFP